MNETSEMPMTEQSPITKISQENLERTISLEKPEPTLTPSASNEIRSADSTTLKRLKELAFQKAGKALMFSVDKFPLAASAASFLVSFGCGNVEKQAPPPTPAPAVSELSTGMPSATIKFTDNRIAPEVPTPPTPTPEPTRMPTQEVSSDSSQSPKQEQAERKELIPYSPSITIIDAAPSVPTEGLIQKEFISNEDMIRKMLGDKYVSKEQIIQEFGENYEEKWDEVVEKYPQALVYRLADTYFNHGEKVTGVIEDTLKRSGLESTGINVEPLQKIFDKDSITFIKDSSGNPGISLNFDPKRIIKLLEGDQSRVINGSFQVGNVELFQVTKKYTDVIPKYDPNDPRFSESGYFLDDGKIFYQGAVESKHNSDGSIDYLDAEGKKVDPISWEDFKRRKLENSEVKEYKSTDLSIVGAYAKEKAMENLPKLFEVANAYPDKFFVFAGGNTGEDFREAMENLKDQVPKNLLITAEWVKGNYGGFEYEGPAGKVYGADIYVNNAASGNPSGSSFSVPELSTVASRLAAEGLSPEQIKSKILAASDIHTVNYDGKEETVRVFNPSETQEK